MAQKKKSPLKDRPLRYAGQSLDERIDNLFDDQILPYFMLSVFMVATAVMEWFRFFRNPKPSPLTISALALVVVLFTIYKVRKNIKKIKAIKQGRDGERAVGQYLEMLRENGHRIFHDILGDNFNIDHVIISRKGVFVVETKTYSKPEKGRAEIHFNGKKLSMDSVGVQTGPITQVSASSKWLADVLLETTGKRFPVKPVILFPGWYVKTDSEGKKSSDIWVLNPKALPSFIENSPDVISQEDMMLASFHTSRYIRTKEAVRFKEG